MTATERILNTVVVGGGQAGLAMSRHLAAHGLSHVVLEKARIAEAWRTARWDALVANGPAWHDRFPDLEFDTTPGPAFATKDNCARYFQHYAEAHRLPVVTGTEVMGAAPLAGGGFAVETAAGTYRADNIVAATGAFHIPLIPPLVPKDAPVLQVHSQSYKNPEMLPKGAVLVVGAGSSGSQIADELLRAGRRVYLSIGPHERPPRRYRGHDYCHWLGVLGKWAMKTPPEGREHVTISVSGAHGGQTVDFRNFAARGMTLLGMADRFENGVLCFKDDIADNIRAGDEYYLALLDEIDAHIAAHKLDLPWEEEAKIIGPDPLCMTEPRTALDLAAEGIQTIIWATGYRQNFDWLKVDTFDERGRPRHRDGVSEIPGVYFLGLPWLSMRGSSFIWGVYVDAERLAGLIAQR